MIRPILLAVALASCTSAPPPGSWITLREPLVYDGDTLYATATTLPPELAAISIRVRGIDTPEIRGECEAEKVLALEARDYVRDQLANGATVSLGDLDWDKYGGRVLATVYLDGHDLGAMLISQGLARPYDGGARQSWCD